MASAVTRRKFLGTAGTMVAGGGSVSAAAEETAETERSQPIKIVGICCSPRQGKTTAASLAVCLEAARNVDNKIDSELIELAGMKIDGSLAAGLPLEPGQRDDFPDLVPKLSDPNITAQGHGHLQRMRSFR